MSGMRFVSTRNAALSAGFAEVIERGLAPDGGLYVPSEWPSLSPQRLAGAVEAWDGGSGPSDAEQGRFGTAHALAALGQRVIEPFAADSLLASALEPITAEAFSFDAPLIALDPASRLSVLELFHGPTAAFKDFGAQFLAASLARLRRDADRTLTILVATSGDTGGAVAAAFHRRPGIEVVVLYPKGLVSPIQERQLTCWDGNVRTLAVRGTFDACQRLVKAAFLDPALRAKRELSSANSINLGRLLPQVVYYAAASLAVWRQSGEAASFIVPAGNLGNSLACLWARKLGLPIADVVLAHNANRTVPDFLRTGTWQPRPSVATLASAMDVGDPSNMERVNALFPDFEHLRGAIEAQSVDDAQIRNRIRSAYAQYGRIWCPHTAAAAEVYERLAPQRRARGRWVIVATAHAAKFAQIVEPLIGHPIEMPRSLAALFARPVRCAEIDADLGALRHALN